MKKASENDVLKGCLQYLGVVGVFCWRQNQGAVPNGRGGYRSFVGLKGVSDILGVVPESDGRLLAVEVKKPGGKPRKEQAAFLARVEAEGGLALLVSSIDELRAGIEPHLMRRKGGGE